MIIRVKNVILPYEPLTNYDLIDAVKELKIKCLFVGYNTSKA